MSDNEWFILINATWANALLDLVLPLVRHKYFWLPLYIFIAYFFIKKHHKNGVWALLFCFVCFGLSNTLSAEVLKPYFKLDRPCNDAQFKEHVVLRVDCGPGKSFPSAHATNHFALSFYLLLVLGRKYKWLMAPLVFWAALVSYAQVYVGVHYPLDVLVGALLGIIIGTGLGWVFNRLVGLSYF